MDITHRRDLILKKWNVKYSTRHVRHLLHPTKTTTEQMLWLAYRRRLVLAYHLCRGPFSWSSYRDQRFQVDEEDNPSDWWKNT